MAKKNFDSATRAVRRIGFFFRQRPSSEAYEYMSRLKSHAAVLIRNFLPFVHDSSVDGEDENVAWRTRCPAGTLLSRLFMVQVDLLDAICEARVFSWSS